VIMKKTEQRWLLEINWGGFPMWWGDEDWTEDFNEARVFTSEKEAEDFGWDRGLDDVYPVPL